ncbi:hypothetical protein B296_00057295 [Ensete ventricosum]|uniref:Uncharacterized protein n=1 Tax=Ensete ventricosum TaxID=4639 RepID=A0A426WY56_ENSVE|nr:hypothetical protein B296_00057295 [Ensete ventricosum]
MVFMRKISFKLRVMRLYRVESLYVFLLRFCNKGNKEEVRSAPMQGRPPTARPRPRLARKGLRIWARWITASPQGGRLLGGARKWWPQVASPQAATRGAAARGNRQRPTHKGLPPVGMTTTAQMLQEGLGHPFEKRTILPL